jgi:uncharacterized protein (DUF1800 family)
MLSTTQKLQHLYARAGFDLSPLEWKRRQNWSVEKAIDDLFLEAKRSLPFGGFEDDAEGKEMMQLQMGDLPAQERRELAEKLRKENRRLLLTGVNRDWIHRMADPARAGFMEKMLLFWHGHFAVQTLFGGLARVYLNALHQHALGRFSDLTMAIATDPAMILFLNNQQNHKDKPNENFARELMELFTLGRGHYSEKDIQEAARAFTGWACIPLKGTFVYKEEDHDTGQKTFFGQTGNWNGQDIIRMIMSKEETAVFVTKKIYRFFVNDTPNEDRVKVLADSFYASGYDIKSLLKEIFSSDWFYDSENVGNRVKSPVELIAGLLKTFHGTFDDPTALAMGQSALGQVLFFPPSVAGWNGGKSWIDNQRLLLRLQLPMILFEAAEVDIQLPGDPQAVEDPKTIRKLRAEIDAKPLMKALGHQSYTGAKSLLIQYLLPGKKADDLDWLESFIPPGEPTDRILATAIRICSLPEYQLA